jgi:hypothetical protein
LFPFLDISTHSLSRPLFRFVQGVIRRHDTGGQISFFSSFFASCSKCSAKRKKCVYSAASISLFFSCFDVISIPAFPQRWKPRALVFVLSLTYYSTLPSLGRLDERLLFPTTGRSADTFMFVILRVGTDCQRGAQGDGWARGCREAGE